MTLSQIRKQFKTGDISVYPLIAKQHGNAYIKIVSAKTGGNRWVETDHSGFTTWQEALAYMEAEIAHLSHLNALTYVSREQAREYYHTLNPQPNVVNAPEPDDEDSLQITDDGISSIVRVYDDEDSDRYNAGYWEPILRAWEQSYSSIKEQLSNRKLVEL